MPVNARLVFLAGAVLSVPAALLVMIAESPADAPVSWPVYLAGFAALVAAVCAALAGVALIRATAMIARRA
jgi:hypothetical protein